MEERVRPDIRIKAIATAIPALDPEKDFTKGGKPEVAALEAVLGFDINADERDAAYESVQAAPAGGTVATLETVMENMRKAGKKV